MYVELVDRQLQMGPRVHVHVFFLMDKWTMDNEMFCYHCYKTQEFSLKMLLSFLD